MLAAGTALMAASMVTWIIAALQVSLTLVIIGLTLSGLGMGVSSPSFQTAITGAVDARDLGIASGMGTTMVNIGILSGIQTSFVILGDGRAAGDFARTFVVGAVVAALGGIGALMMDRR
jgi:MFS family permease